MNCNFVFGRKGWYCKRCREQAGVVSSCPPVRACAAPSCKRLGQPAGEIKVRCHECNGKRETMQPVYSCDMHGRCLPQYKPTAELLVEWNGPEKSTERTIYKLCQVNCTDYQA